MASVRGILNIQSLNELTYEKWWLSCRCPMVVVAQMCGESVVLVDSPLSSKCLSWR